MLNRTLSLYVLCTLLTTSAFSEIVFDQIGPMDGSQIGNAVATNQYFEDGLQSYDIAVLEYVVLAESHTLTQIEIVIDGWDGFADPSSITSYEFNVYTDIDSAAISLQGDVHTEILDATQIQVSSDWKGVGYLLQIPIAVTLQEGSYWVSVIPKNDSVPDGQVGICEALIGDGIHSMQANPGEAYGFGPIRSLGLESAFRIHDDVFIDPCTLELPSCPEDITNDGYVTISDLLEIIAHWGDCGNGEFRPTGDCAPLPFGDCCVNIADVLAVVAAWDAECSPHGACCLPEGICEDKMTADNCLQNEGVYFGNETTCVGFTCSPSACCLDTTTCIDVSSYRCDELGGALQFGTLCTTADCTILAVGDECENPIVADLGSVSFNTTFMSPSLPAPDDSFCVDTSLEWNNSPDVWFAFTPPSAGFFSFSLCDLDSYDTSLVLYEENCNTQVACNGDAENPDTDTCQEFYSQIEHMLDNGITYYVRIGGWYGQTGEGTLTISELPPPTPGACCFANGSCADTVTIEDCESFDGTFMGGDTLCENAECIIIEGDECDEAAIATIGINLFSTEYATPSTPVPNDAMCSDTYLEWENTPDIWLKWHTPDSGSATFTTCDSTSFDTSIVLYEGNCTTQVACNGDAESDSNCQNFHSEIVYEVSSNTNYYIRIGGWQGTVGEGTLTISLDGDNDQGACCVESTCFADQTEDQCNALNGKWIYGETCKIANCENIPCNSATFTQNPHSPDDNWYAANASSDSNFERSEFITSASINAITVWGLQAYFDGSQWSECDEAMRFSIRTYDDLQGLPGPLVNESIAQPSSRIATGTLYAGLYELMQWEIAYSDTNVEHIGIQAETKGFDCWFLWMSSGTGDGYSSANSGANWTFENFDLSICIE